MLGTVFRLVSATLAKEKGFFKKNCSTNRFSTCSITFRHENKEAAKYVALAGDFNAWSLKDKAKEKLQVTTFL